MSQFFNDQEIRVRVLVNQLWPWKNLKGKKLRIFKKMLFSWERLLNADIYKALKRFAECQGPICYNDAQNKEMNLIVY